MGNENANSTEKRPLKRARPVHSCLECRVRKLKCDRKTPCEQCIKAERPEVCNYDAKAGSMSRLEDDTADPRPSQVRRLNGHTNDHANGAPIGATEGRGIIEDLQSRVDRLEALLSNPENAVSYGESQTLGQVSLTNVPDGWIPGTVEVKDGRSKFRPLCHKSAILYRFAEAKNFISTKINQPATISTLRGLRRSFPKINKRDVIGTRQSVGRDLLPKLYELIPSRAESDLLVNTFFEEGQSLHCILDRRKFSDLYKQFWSLSPHAQSTSSFTALLVLIISIASMLDSRTTNYSIQMTCDLVEDWLHGIAGKELSDLITLQIEALLVFAMQCSGIITEHVYRTSGRLVRSAFISGLQYDPGHLSQIPEDEVNARRRLWTAIAELDLQASLTVGLPCALDSKDFTCQFPSDPDREELGRQLGETLAMRLEGGRLSRLKAGERGKAMQAIKAMEKAQQSAKAQATPLSKAFFDTVCHRSLVAFVRPLLEGPTLAFGRLSGCRSSLVVLEHLEKLKSKPHQWNFYFRVCNQDIFQAVLVACLMLRIRNVEVNITPPIVGVKDYSMMPQPAEISDKIRRALHTMLFMISPELVGEFIKDLIVLSVVVDSAEHPMNTEQQQIGMEQGFQLVLDSLSDRVKVKGSSSASPSDSGGSSSATASTFIDGLLDMDNAAWMSNGAFNFDFGLPLDQNFGMENGLLNNPGADLAWAGV